MLRPSDARSARAVTGGGGLVAVAAVVSSFLSVCGCVLIVVAGAGDLVGDREMHTACVWWVCGLGRVGLGGWLCWGLVRSGEPLRERCLERPVYTHAYTHTHTHTHTHKP